MTGAGETQRLQSTAFVRLYHRNAIDHMDGVIGAGLFT